MNAPIPLHEAQAELLRDIAPLSAQEVSISDAFGRYLAQPLLARRTQPAADLSAMDGYAMREGETGPWRMVGESSAGHPYQGIVGPGEAVRISTGALMPQGADAVLLQENALRENDRLSLNGEGDPSPRHIRRMGFDFRESDMLLPLGTRMGPGQVALALSGGHAALSAHRKPSIHIFDSGDELTADPTNREPHKLPASNALMIAGLVKPLISRMRLTGPVPDRIEALRQTLDSAADADVIVTSGGASVGDHDLIRPALAEWGADITFWRVAMKPGKPLLLARKGNQIVLGLPGNPVSSFVTGFFFLLPLLRALSGDTDPLPRPVMLPLGADVPEGGSRLEFLRGKHVDGVVTSLAEQDSSALRTLAMANVLIERPANAPVAPRGTPVPAYLIENGGIA